MSDDAPSRLRPGIGTQMAAAFLVIVLVATLPVTVWTLNHSRGLVEDYTNESVVTLLKSDTGLLRLAIADRDYWQLYKIVSAVAAPDHVDEAVVLDNDGRVLAHSNPQQHPLLSAWEGAGDATVEEIAIEGFRGDIGRLVVAWNGEGVAAAFTPARRSIFVVSTVSALLAAGIGVLIAYSLRARLTRILRKVQQRDTLSAVNALRDDGPAPPAQPSDQLAALEHDLVGAVDKLHLAQWVLDRVDEIVLLVDRSGKIVFCSAAMRRTGCPYPYCGGDLRSMLHEDGRNRVFELLESGTGGTVEASVEVGDHLFPALVSCQPQQDMALITIKDISDLQRLRERMNRLHALSALGELSTELAHEIKNDVVPVRLLCEVAPMEPEDREAVLRSLNHIDELVNDFMAFCRGEHSGNGETAPLSELAHQSVETLTHAAREKGVDLRVEVDAETARNDVLVPAGGLRMVIGNLVRNAIQAAPKEGGRVRLRARQRRAGLQIEVADNGPGIAPEIQERLFEPFVTDKEGGTGLGLALAYRYVALAAGTIYYHQGSNGGAVFTVMWPLTRRAPGGQQKPEHADASGSAHPAPPGWR